MTARLTRLGAPRMLQSYQQYNRIKHEYSTTAPPPPPSREGDPVAVVTGMENM